MALKIPPRPGNEDTHIHENVAGQNSRRITGLHFISGFWVEPAETQSHKRLLHVNEMVYIYGKSFVLLF